MKYFALIVFVVVLASCKKTNLVDGYSLASNGLYYKLLSIGDGSAKLLPDQVIVADAQMCTLTDSVFWDTRHFGVNELYFELNDSTKLKPFYSHLIKLTEGDSVSYLLEPTYFFNLFFSTPVPNFCKKDTLVKINFKINQIISKYEYKELQHLAQFGSNKDTELEELQLIDNYLVQNKFSSKPNDYGIYELSKTSTTDDKVEIGKKIKIEFESWFVDGKPLDNGVQTLEFIYGTPDQLIKGLNIVISTLKKGETSKIIVPSRLAFGEQGSSNGNVPPYTPIVYKIKIIDIK